MLVVLALAGRAGACITDVGVDTDSPPADFVFPNWVKATVAIFNLEWCDAATCPGSTDATIEGLTLINYGNATGGAAGDITGMYACFDCYTAPGPCTPASASAATLTFAGVWNVDGSPRQAWTWEGSIPLAADPCASCACMHLMRVFVDIAPCPTAGNTIQLGPGYDPLKDPIQPGGIMDALGCDAPATP
ncbi:MAG: hypothetical protein AAB368_05190, partial [bacterium]